MRRSRPIVFGAVAVIVAAGLGIVAFADRFPSWVRPHFGDVLVVIAIYFALAFIAPAAHSLRLSIVTLVYAFAVECTQLYHTPALDRFRSTLLGQLSIGATFSWMDLVCYVIGVAVAFGFDKRFVLRFHRLRSDWFLFPEVSMARLVTLFTGQWADLPLETLCKKAKAFGYDGLELACWGDHFEVEKADKSYVKRKWELLKDHGLTCHAISAHLVGQAICDRIDERHKSILPPEVWGDGDPEGVRKRAAKRMIETAKAARLFRDAAPDKIAFPAVVNGFTGSSIWHSIYAFPPTSQDYWQKGFDDFAKRFGPILDAFEKANVNFALEVHPTEIAFDIVSAQRALDAVKNHKRFGFNYDPSHLGYQGVDYVKFIYTFGKRIFHSHVKDAWWGKGDGTVGVFGGHTTFADPRRFWDFRSPGHGDVDFERVIVALNDVGYQGPLSVEWEDSRMDREHGATEAATLVRKLDFKPSAIAFDAQFDR